MLRLNFAGILFKKYNININLKNKPESMKLGVFNKLDFEINIDKLTQAFNKYDEKILAEKLINYLFPKTLNNNISKEMILKLNGNEITLNDYLIYLMTLPEFQMC